MSTSIATFSSLHATATLRLAAASLAIVTATARQALAGGGAQYIHDDGQSESAFGLQYGGDLCVIHWFNASGGADLIQQISAAYAHPAAPAPPVGTPVTLCIWEDPWNSGDPLEAELLTTAEVLLENPNTDTLNVYFVPETLVIGSFWIGFYLTHESGEYPASFDSTDSLSNGLAWLAGSSVSGAFDPTELGANEFPPVSMRDIQTGVFLLRAEGAGLQGSTYCFGDGLGTACPCGNASSAPEMSGCMNSSGLGAAAVGTGSASVALDDFGVFARRLLPGQPALLFAGRDALNGGMGIPFGDGLRCAGTNVVRLGTRVPDSTGVAHWGPGLREHGGWRAGDTRRFQVWYRDPSGSPCGSQFNLTNGVEQTFVP